MDRFRGRAVIERISPEVDGGRFPAKAVAGDELVVEADVFADGHDAVGAELRVRRLGERPWTVVPMSPLDDDRRRATFSVGAPGRWEFVITAWVDSFATWRRHPVRRAEAALDIWRDLHVGHTLLVRAATDARDDGDRGFLDDAVAVVGDVAGRPEACDLDRPVRGVGGAVTLGDVVLGDELRRAVARSRVDDGVTGDIVRPA